MSQEDWGLTDKGYYCPTFEEILDQKIKRASELFGDDIATGGATPLGKLLRIEAAEDHKIYEEQEEVYYSLSPVTATGVSLDRLCALVGIKRNVAICAKHLIRVYGTQGTVIKAGMLFRTTAGVKFYATSDAVITKFEGNINDNDMYYAEVIVQCTEAGTVGNVYNINAPVTVSSGISSVQYYSTITEGENTETDDALRSRYNTVVNGMGSNTAASIIANVLKVNGVHGCKIRNNTSLNDIVISDKLTVTADTYAVIVYAGSDIRDEIAEAIYQKMPVGVRQSGTEEIYITDDAGEEQLVRFTFVDEITADVSVSCQITSEFSKDGTAEIRSNIEDYINGLELGETLVWSQLYKCIYAVSGVVDTETLTVAGGTNNLTATSTDIIRCGTVSITVTEV